MPGQHTQLSGLTAHVADLPRRKLLVSDYNELKLQQAEGEGRGSEVTGPGDEREDPTILKLKLT